MDDSQKTPETKEPEWKWWLRYIVVPLIGSGGIIAIIVAMIIRPAPIPTPQPSDRNVPIATQSQNSIPQPIVNATPRVVSVPSATLGSPTKKEKPKYAEEDGKEVLTIETVGRLKFASATQRDDLVVFVNTPNQNNVRVPVVLSEPATLTFIWGRLNAEDLYFIQYDPFSVEKVEPHGSKVIDVSRPTLFCFVGKHYKEYLKYLDIPVSFKVKAVK